MKALTVAIAGLGVVGSGTLAILHRQSELLQRRVGRPVRVVAVSARDRNRDRGVPLDGIRFYDDAVAMAREVEADVIVEVIGGADGVALEVCRAALARGLPVVTANKAMMAKHGLDLARRAEAKGVALGYEAAVAGGIPIIKALREGLAANRISQIYGILNGTCNYILSIMRRTGRDFADVLAEAQALGYAEADPSFDIDGIDSAHKLAILTSLAFGAPVDLNSVSVEGIRRISALDIQYAEELGYRIKLLGIARKSESGIEQSVHPCMVPLSSPIAHVEDVFNAVVAEGDFVGRSVYEGRGAGAGPTASAIVADLVDIGRGIRLPVFGVPVEELRAAPAISEEDHRGAYYVRLMVVDKPGVFADIATILRDEDVSMEAVLQRARDPGETVPVVLTVHDTAGRSMRRAIDKIKANPALVEEPMVIHIETL